jgi:hypothetical protein
MSRKNLSLIVGAASLALAAALSSSPATAGFTRPPGACADTRLANPKPGKDDDDSGDTGDDSGDATPMPEPQPATSRS